MYIFNLNTIFDFIIFLHFKIDIIENNIKIADDIKTISLSTALPLSLQKSLASINEALSMPKSNNGLLAFEIIYTNKNCKNISKIIEGVTLIIFLFVFLFTT